MEDENLNVPIPEDFMFELTQGEFENLRCQIGTSSWESTRYAPMPFTDHGVVILAIMEYINHLEEEKQKKKHQ